MAEIAEEDAEAAEAEEAMVSDGAAGAATPQATETTVKVVTSFAPGALPRCHGQDDDRGSRAFMPRRAYETAPAGADPVLRGSNLYPILEPHKRDFYGKTVTTAEGRCSPTGLCTCPVLFSRRGRCAPRRRLVIAEPVGAFALETTVPNAKCDKALADHIEAIFRIAAANGTETLIVGAFGCGRNGYPVEQVIELIQNWITRNTWRRSERGVRRTARHADAFREAFGARGPSARARRCRQGQGSDREGDDEDWRNVELPEGVTLAKDGCSLRAEHRKKDNQAACGSGASPDIVQKAVWSNESRRDRGKARKRRWIRKRCRRGHRG